MVKVGFPVYLEEEEKEEFMKLAQQRGVSLAQYIRECLRASKENPDYLNPTTNKTDLDIFLKALELSANERVNKEEAFKLEVVNRLDKLEEGQQLLLKKAAVSKKDRKQTKYKDEIEDVIFTSD